MFMRLVKVKLKPDALVGLRTLYADRVIAALQETHGCRYSGLMQSAHHPDECISLTLWDTEEDAVEYERSGMFSKLVAEARPFLSESSESKIQLSHDLTLEYVPVPEEPVVDKFPVAAKSDPVSTGRPLHNAHWLRIVSLRIQAGKIEQFKRMYADQVIPTLRKVKGCRYIYLTECAERPNEVISVTSWDSEQDAVNYESSGLFDRILESQRHMLSELYQWKRERDRNQEGSAASSEDLTVEHYIVIIGKDFT